MAIVNTPSTADGDEIVSTLSGFQSVLSVAIAGASVSGYSFNGTDTLTIPSQDYYLAEVSGSAPLIGQDVTIDVSGTRYFVDFDRDSTQYVLLDSELSISDTDDFVISIDVKTSNSTDTMTVIGTESDFKIQIVSGVPQALLGNGSSWVLYLTSGTANIADGEWHTLTFTKSGTSCVLASDGGAVDSDTTSSASAPSVTAIGARSTLAVPFDGLLANAYVSDGGDLSAYWALEEDVSGTTIAVDSISGNNGTYVNSPTNTTGSTSATDTFQITPADGWAVTELTSIDYAEVISAIESEVGVTIAIGDSFYYEQVGGDDPDTGGTLIGADGLFEFSSDFRLILIQGGSSTEAADWYVLNVEVSEEDGTYTITYETPYVFAVDTVRDINLMVEQVNAMTSSSIAPLEYNTGYVLRLNMVMKVNEIIDVINPSISEEVAYVVLSTPHMTRVRLVETLQKLYEEVNN